MPTLSLRLDEQQLLELAAKARAHGCKRGYLLKADSSKLKRLTNRWCCVFNNTLFYFESESVPKPLGVVFLEGTCCRPVEQIGLPGREIEGAFCVANSYGDQTSSCKSNHYFMAKNDKERDSWIEAINKANMGRLKHDLDELKDKCSRLEAQMVTKMSEVDHLKRANQQAQEEITHLKKILSEELPRRRSSSFLPSPPRGSPPPNSDPKDYHARVLQGYIRSWLIRRRWRKVIEEYLASPQASLMRKRNQLIWKFVASEEDYVSQLTVLTEEFHKQCEIGAHSCNPPLTLDQCDTIFRNSEELLLFHQLFLRGLHSRIEKWPVVMFGEVLKLFIPVMSIYHQYVGSHSHAYDLLLSLLTKPNFKSFLEQIQGHPACNNMNLESVLVAPLKRMESYIHDLQELRSHTPPEHVDYNILQEIVSELEIIQKTVTDEVSQYETLRQVLEVENSIEDGCEVLLDKEQTLIRQGILHQVRVEDKLKSPSRNSGKVRSQPRHCFLFSKHLLITARVQKKPQDQYRIVKLVPLAKCGVSEVRSEDSPEVHYRGIRVSCDPTDSLILLTNSVNEKAQWLADFSQCVENEKQNKILQFQSVGEPVELSSRFIRYSTFKTGKEQLVNCGTLESLLERLVKVSHYGLDFLNTFLMTFPLYTTAHHILDFLSKSYHDCLSTRERKRSGSITPQDAVRDAREIPSLPRCSTASPTGSVLTYGSHLTIPRPNGVPDPAIHTRTASESSMKPGPSISGIFFAVKHWISKHFYHFEEDTELASKLELLLEHAYKSPLLTMNEKNAAVEASSMYSMQKGAREESSPVLEYMRPQSPVHLPQKPFECLLLWAPRETAEQLSIIESTLFSKIENSEILRYFKAKGEEKARVAPNLTTIFDHFNRMSLFFMWSVAHQRYFADRVKVLEFLIEVTQECVDQENFSSFMQLMSALEHGSIQKFKQAWEFVSKNLKQQFRNLKRLSATDGRFKELRTAIKKAIPPSVPYLGIALNELSGVVESQPNLIDDGLINFSKMRRCTRLVTAVLQHQKEPYEFQFVPEISKVLLCTSIPGDEDALYQYVEQLKDRQL